MLILPLSCLNKQAADQISINDITNYCQCIKSLLIVSEEINELWEKSDKTKKWNDGLSYADEEQLWRLNAIGDKLEYYCRRFQKETCSSTNRLNDLLENVIYKHPPIKNQYFD